MSHAFRFGSFIAPFHAADENPTECLERDLQLIQLMDRLGYDEAWIGEHHSGGLEMIASPELFIMAAAERTKTIRLGTGVSSLPYHNPFMLAERMNLLDHLTRGRAMFGVGPGSLSSDAHMLGVPVAEARDRMEDALDVIVRLLNGETVTKRGAWYNLVDARLHLDPYTQPHIELAVANAVSPSGVRLAGKYGAGVLALSATSSAGFNALATQWAIANERAAAFGKQMNRDNWRLVGSIHIAETRAQAIKDIEFGFPSWLHYMTKVANLPIIPPGAEPLAALMESGGAVIGTPDDVVLRIQQLQEQSGGFGCFLIGDNDWAAWGPKQKSYEMMARYVFPRIKGGNTRRQASLQWLQDNNEYFSSSFLQAVGESIKRHVDESGGANISPIALERLNLGDSKGASLERVQNDVVEDAGDQQQEGATTMAGQSTSAEPETNIRSVTAKLNYIAETELRPVIWNENFARNVIPIAPADVRIADAGSLPQPCDLDREGFVLTRAKTDLTDLETSEDAASRYRESLVTVMLQLTGADRITVSPASVFRRAVSSHGNDLTNAAPAAFVHADYSPLGLEQTADAVFEPPDRPLRRRASYNMWRLLSKGPTDLPLAVCDARSVKPTDVIVGDSRFETMEFFFETVFIKASADHRWMYYPAMTADDLLVFKQSDSAGTGTTFVPHSAFADPSCPSGAAPRVSIECRCMAYWY